MNLREKMMVSGAGGLALVVAGFAKVVTKLSSMGVLDTGWCGDGISSLPTHMSFVAGFAFDHMAHCWGCPAVAGGSALLLVSIAAGSLSAPHDALRAA